MTDLAVIDGDKIVQEVAHDAEGYLVGDLDADALGECGHWGVDQLALLP